MARVACEPKEANCIEIFQPVCGTDDITYGNKCFAEAACQLDGSTPGKCTCTPNPDVVCGAIQAPVCGKDTVTYSNPCFAKAACQLDGSTPGSCT